MKLYFVRHCEVVERYHGRYNGHLDIPLSQKGKADAKLLAQKLSCVDFDRAFCSDLLRAKQTIEPFKLRCEIIYTERLREKSWGRHEGKSFAEITKEGLKYTTFTKWINDLDGENFHHYAQRLLEYFQNVLLKQKGENILVVTHAGVIKTLISLLNKIDLEESFSTPLPYGSYVCYHNERFILKS